jgi:hypothetical protein
MGAGLGHAANLRPIARELQKRGHRVVLALREFGMAAQFFDGLPYVAAPAAHRLPEQPVVQAATYADLLFNAGCATAEQLGGLVGAWRHLFDLVRPEVVVMEYSPLALLALQGYPARHIVVGTGFYAPPDISPLPALRLAEDIYPDRLLRTERIVLGVMNRILEGFNQPPLERVGQLFTRTDTNFLATFRELDHYPDRIDGNYVGTWSSVKGAPPDWPLASSSDRVPLRIFVYMRPFAELRALLARLRELAHPTIMYMAGTDRDLFAGAATPQIRFVSRPVDMARVSQECDLAILYAPHDTVAAMLLAGKPMLLIPQHNEQLIMARSVERLGAAFVASDHDGKQIVAGLDAVIHDDRYSRAARAFADKYSAHRSGETLARVVDRIESLANSATVPS